MTKSNVTNKADEFGKKLDALVLALLPTKTLIKLNDYCNKTITEFLTGACNFDKYYWAVSLQFELADEAVRRCANALYKTTEEIIEKIRKGEL